MIIKLKIILAIIMILFCLTGCFVSRYSNAPDSMPTINPTNATVAIAAPIISATPEKSMDEAPAESIPTGITSGNVIDVHNTEELLSNMASGKHLRLISSGDFDLTKYQSTEKSKFVDLANVTLEGMGETPVVIHAKSNLPDILTFDSCSDITLINIEFSLDQPDSGNIDGNMLSFYGQGKNIMIKNCMLSSDVATALYVSDTESLICKNTVIRNNSEHVIRLDRLDNAGFTDCSFSTFPRLYIHITGSNKVVFSDCMFSSSDRVIFDNDETVLYLYMNGLSGYYAENVTEEIEDQGIRILDSVCILNDYAQFYTELVNGLTPLFLEQELSIKLRGDEYAPVGLLIQINMPYEFSNIQMEYQNSLMTTAYL